MVLQRFFLLLSVFLPLAAAVPAQIKLVHDLLDKYDKKAKPVWDSAMPINVSFSMDLYQILELNEPQQYILLNAWIIERWYDEFLYWHPDDYQNISEIRLPFDSIWLPDTTLYNSLVMKDDDTRRLLNVKLTPDKDRRASLIELLYPTIYKFSCLLDLRFFPFDVQVCTMTFSSWTYDQKGIDYFPYSESIGTTNYLENEGWYILKTKVTRNEVKYSCCPNKYTLLQLTLYLRRKPLFYLVNLIIPTSIITLIAIVGFFTTSSASGMREEKVSLGITTLLSMSILMLMVSDQMPTTSTFIPLIGWFILAMIIVISLGTIVSSVIIAIQKRGSLGERLSKGTVRFAKFLAYITCTGVPPHIEKEQMMDAFDAPSPTVEVRPLKPVESKKWLTLRESFRKAKNGVAVVSDKSTDPLIHMTPSTTGEALSPGNTPLTSNPPAPVCDDEISIIQRKLSQISSFSDYSKVSLTSDYSKAATSGRTKTNGKNAFAVLQKRTLSTRTVGGSIKHTRQLAIAEFEWLASVVERSCFVLFVCFFLMITIGINVIGFHHWYKAGVDLGVA